jgi:hypothetical protein
MGMVHEPLPYGILSTNKFIDIFKNSSSFVCFQRLSPDDMTQRVEVSENFGSYFGRDTTILKLFVVLTSPSFANTVKVS